MKLAAALAILCALPALASTWLEDAIFRVDDFNGSGTIPGDHVKIPASMSC